MSKTPKTPVTTKTSAKTTARKAPAKARATVAEAKVETVKPKPAPKPESITQQPSPEPKAAPQPHTAAASPLFDAENIRRLEELSLNIAKATMTAQNVLARTVMKQPDLEAAGAPSDPFQVGPAMTEVMKSLATRPDKVVEAQSDLLNGYLELWGQMARRTLGAPDEKKPVKDKRFADPRWEQNLVFDMMRQSYLLSSNWLNKLIGSVDDIDPLVKRRAEFFTKLLTDAMSPANFLLTNPVAINALLDSKGETLVKGMQMFADDLARGDGKLKISQADYSRFKVGENVATTPGKVVYRGDYFELLQYAPTTEQVYEIPLLIFPPWINKFYILDLQAKNSLIKWLVGQGFTVFVVSWVNPDASMKDTTFEDYMFGGIYEATQKVIEQTGAKTVNTVGYCIGGTLLGCTLAHMAEKGDTSINSATFFTAQHDFTEAGDLLLFTSENWLKELERQMDAAGGVLPGSAMADTFNALRANDLVWSFFVSNYLLGKDLTPFDLLCWNADQTRMPKALHIFYLRNFYGHNALSKGELTLGGVKLDLKKVKVPIYEQAGREDHIAPPASVYKGSKLFGGPVTYMLAGSGHIAGVVNHPAAQKYMHWLNDAHPDTLEEWLEGATEHPGSWWPHWAGWLGKQSGKKIAARDPSKGEFKVLGDAPGTYVLVKS
ncbi:poly(R)-hydroxyalkanoic acid synthase [Asticcacaulis sp. AC460]|uniref:class I poly(R)-hydroxyalkanoic acid synthase n=1 Tax=Asticcacaulis sp. AC460 TaxID=1282360 RepID=UPI0003C3BD31|nr:class I poly(R)-hydroxyalkanoic acid synthase [Asticcacaulis sp. AC460]ESQ89575.1 poly(R)-hydroxyalkanoic acid synthase [Asticcacaulis sp. AC460]